MPRFGCFIITFTSFDTVLYRVKSFKVYNRWICLRFCVYSNFLSVYVIKKSEKAIVCKS